jgi:hypothetical protein
MSKEHKKYLFNIERDVIKYGNEGIQYKPYIPTKNIKHKINHSIIHKKDIIQEETKITPDDKKKEQETKIPPDDKKKEKKTKKIKHHMHEHADDVLNKITTDEEQKQKAKEGLNAIYANTITKPTHDDITLQQREYALMNEASYMHGHGSTKDEINNYLKQNGLKNYNIDFANSTNNGLTFVNKNNGKATIAFRGSSLGKRAKSDWTSNAEILASPNFNTKAHFEIDNFFNDVNELYDVEHITGYSRGGHFATYLANKYDIPSTTFNPFISPSIIKNFKKNNKSNHTIINTTEDIVSPLASVLKLNNNNVNIRTIYPLDEKSTLIDPIAGHDNINFTNPNNASRTTGRRYNLHNQIVSNGKKIGELQMVQKAKTIFQNGGSFTDFIKSVNPNDVNETRSLIDGSKTIEFSKRIKGAGKEAQIWNQIGGEMTRLENIKLNQNPQTEAVEFETTRVERINHSQANYHERQKTIETLENELKDNINKLNTNITESNDIKLRQKLGLTPKSIGSMVVGSAVGSQIEQKQTSEFVSGAVATALAGGKILTGGISTLGSAELGSAVSSLIDDKDTANIVDNAVTFGTAPVVQAITEFGIGRIATGVGLAVATPFVAPELAVVAGLTAVGAGIGTLVNALNK